MSISLADVDVLIVEHRCLLLITFLCQSPLLIFILIIFINIIIHVDIHSF